MKHLVGIKRFDPNQVPAGNIVEARDGFEINPDVAYPYWLGLLGFPTASPDRSQLECARLCATEYCHRILKLKKYLEAGGLSTAEAELLRNKPGLLDPKALGETKVGMYIRIKAEDGSRRWALKNFPEGEGIYAPLEYERLKREGKVEL